MEPSCLSPLNAQSNCQIYYPDFTRADVRYRTCGPAAAEISQNHVAAYPGFSGGVGEDADFYLILTASTASCEGAVAWATTCLLDDPPSLQPRLGAANFCPDQADLLSGDPEAALAALLHEIIHALGFSGGLYDYYIDPSSSSQTDPSYGTKTVTFRGESLTVGRNVFVVNNPYSGYGGERLMLQTPKLAAYVQTHFGCASGDYSKGAVLEDGGGDSSAGACVRPLPLSKPLNPNPKPPNPNRSPPHRRLPPTACHAVLALLRADSALPRSRFLPRSRAVTAARNRAQAATGSIPTSRAS